MTYKQDELRKELKNMKKAELLEYAITTKINHDNHMNAALSLVDYIREKDKQEKAQKENDERNLENAKLRIIHLLTDPFGSHGLDAIKELFWALNSCSQGYVQGQKKSGMIGYLDDANRETLAIVLSDRETRTALARGLYYNTLDELCEHRVCHDERGDNNIVCSCCRKVIDLASEVE